MIIIYFSYDYQYASTELIFEATLHHDFYTDSNDYRTFKKIEQKMIERDLNSILLVEENYINASSTYKFLVKIFTQDINVPYIPNIVAIISFVSLLINRTEMWGIFIAKYNPDFFGALFGSGPMQLNDYLYGHNIKLDVPKNELTSLFLPHSSVLSFIVFFGLLGLSICLYNFVLLCFNKNKNTLYFVPSLYLVINFLKSDSLLYLNSLVFFIFLLVMSTYKKNLKIEMNKLIYITYQTFPSKKANTIQTIENLKYIAQKVNVELIFPNRSKESSGKLSEIQEFYSFNENIKINMTKHNLPFGKINFLEKYLFLFSHLMWARKLAKKLYIKIQNEYIFTRSDWIFFFIKEECTNYL